MTSLPTPRDIQLFREWLSEKVRTIIPKGIVGGFEFAACSSKKFERMTQEAMDVCLRVLKESNKRSFDSYSVWNSLLIISLITFRDRRVHIFADNLSRNSCIHTNMDYPSLQAATIHARQNYKLRYERNDQKRFTIINLKIYSLATYLIKIQ